MAKKNVITKLAPKMSDAIQAMIDGLKKQSKRKNFKIDMGTFGGVQDGICFGCAATCTIQQLAGKNLTQKNIEPYQHYKLFNGIEVQNVVQRFETAIDYLRQGNPFSIINFYDKDYDKIASIIRVYAIDLEPLETIGWEENLPEYQRFVDALKEHKL